MRRHDDLDQATLTRCGKRLHVTIENRLEGLLLLPLRVLARALFHLIKRKGKLNVHRVFAPQCAVVVESRHALRHGNETGRTLARHGRNKIQD